MALNNPDGDKADDLKDIEELLKRPGAPWRALTATGIWIALVLWVAVAKGVWCLEANAIGDFVAGAFAPVAFGWLILGYLRQGRELRLQSAEIAYTRKEFAAQTSVLREQADFDKINLNVSLLEKIQEDIPHKMVEIWELFPPFHKLVIANQPTIHFSEWLQVPAAEDTALLRQRSLRLSQAESQFVTKYGLSMKAAFLEHNRTAYYDLVFKASRFELWDRHFRDSTEPMEKSMWETQGQRYALFEFVEVLKRLIG
jgi:hypothetical protein